MSGTNPIEFSALTAPQQAQLLAFMQSFRPTLSAMAVSLRTLSTLADVYNAAIASVVATMDPATVIPDNTGLAGAQPLVAGDLTMVMGLAASALSTLYGITQQAEYIKIAGPGNV